MLLLWLNLLENPFCMLLSYLGPNSRERTYFWFHTFRYIKLCHSLEAETETILTNCMQYPYACMVISFWDDTRARPQAVHCIRSLVRIPGVIVGLLEVVSSYANTWYKTQPSATDSETTAGLFFKYFFKALRACTVRPELPSTLQWPSRQQHLMVTTQGESHIENTFIPVHKTRYYIIIYLL